MSAAAANAVTVQAEMKRREESVAGVGPDRYSSPRHRMQFKSVNIHGFKTQCLMWRATFACPYLGEVEAARAAAAADAAVARDAALASAAAELEASRSELATLTASDSEREAQVASLVGPGRY